MNTQDVVQRTIPLGYENAVEPEAHIVFTTDKRYLPYCGVCIFSIIEKNPDLAIEFHIFTDEYQSLFPDNFFSRYINVRATVYVIDNSGFSGLQTYDFYPESIYYRVLAVDILGAKVDKLLYLDSDIMINGNLTELLDMDMQDNVMAAVQDKGMNKDYLTYLGLEREHRYFNSGVLLINTANWYANNVSERFFKEIKLKKFKFPDQDVLNILLHNKVMLLSEAYNYIPKNNAPVSDPVIIHYAGQTKPWSISIEETGYNKTYVDMYNRSPWRDFPLVAPKKAFESLGYAKKLFARQKTITASIWFSKSMYQYAMEIARRKLPELLASRNMRKKAS